MKDVRILSAVICKSSVLLNIEDYSVVYGGRGKSSIICKSTVLYNM